MPTVAEHRPLRQVDFGVRWDNHEEDTVVSIPWEVGSAIQYFERYSCSFPSAASSKTPRNI